MFIHIVVVFVLLDIMVMMLSYQMKIYHLHMSFYHLVSTTAGRGETMNYQGGEVVVGFFFDGEDGQQPVVFGTLFKQEPLLKIN